MTVQSNYYYTIASPTLSELLSILWHVPQPIRSKTKINRILYLQFIPHFEQVTGNCYVGILIGLSSGQCKKITNSNHVSSIF